MRVLDFAWSDVRGNNFLLRPRRHLPGSSISFAKLWGSHPQHAAQSALVAELP
jgi:hypothetical protein